ncbi:MAG: hypothetical protein AAGD05_19530 [Bacteroidota bacterium]
MKDKIYQLGHRLRWQYAAYFRAWQVVNHLGKFVVFGQGRTGSTLLVDLLNSHPKIVCEEEIYHRHKHPFSGKVRWPYWFLRGIEVRHSGQFFGFKVKIYQLDKQQHLRPTDFLDHLEQRGYQLIYLRRNNFLEHALSGLMAQKTKRFHLHKEESYEHQPFAFSAQELEDRIQRRAMLQNQELDCLQGRTYFEVVYERDLKNSEMHQVICDQIFAYLGLESAPVQTNLRKVIRRAPSDQLSNYTQLKHYFRHTPYQQFFDA